MHYRFSARCATHLLNHVLDFLLLTQNHVIQVLDSFSKTVSYFLQLERPDQGNRPIKKNPIILFGTLLSQKLDVFLPHRRKFP